MTRPAFQMSADARLLYQHIKSANVGDVLTYKVLSGVISRDVNGGTAALRTAMRRCQNDHEIVFAAVRGEGIKRLSDVEIVDEAAATTAAVRRKANRGAGRLMLVNDFDALPERQKQQHMARASILASVAHLTGEKQIDRFIESSGAGSATKELPIAETLRFFS